jgi:hypothetical protein
MRRHFIALTGAVLVLSAASAQAGPFVIDGFRGQWTGVTGGVNVVTDNQTLAAPDTVSWGVPAPAGNGSQSSYVFDPRNGSLNVNDGDVFKIGDFTHNNFIIQTGGGITEAEYRLRLEFPNTPAIPTVPPDYATKLTFEHWETYNQDDPCPNGQPNGTGINIDGTGEPRCADRVLLSIIDKDMKITQDGVDWYFNLLGFSKNGVDFSSSEVFWTREEFKNDIGVYGTLTLQPLPDGGATLALLGCALVGLGALRRKLRK